MSACLILVSDPYFLLQPLAKCSSVHAAESIRSSAFSVGYKIFTLHLEDMAGRNCTHLSLPTFVHLAPRSPPKKKNTGYCTRIFEIQRPRKTPSLSLLVDLLAVEGDTESAEQESAISVVCGGGVDGDVETGDHLGRIPICLVVSSPRPGQDSKGGGMILTCHS